MDDGAHFGDCKEEEAFDIRFFNCFPESMVNCDHILSTTVQSTEGTSTEELSSSTIETTVETSSTTISSTTESGGSDWDYLCKGIGNNKQVPHPNDCIKVWIQKR